MPEIAEVLNIKLAEIDAALKSKNPNLPVLLKEIHTRLLKDKDNVTLLTDEQVGIIIKALSQHTGVVLLEQKKKVSSKKLSSTSLDDL